MSLNDLVTLYDDQSKYAKALPLLKPAVRITKAVLGPDHPITKQFTKSLKVYQDALH